MSWRATEARPAPPTVSRGPDASFVGPTSRSSSAAASSRTSSSLSAAGHLARHMSDADSDSRSVRSVRTVGRARVDSFASVASSRTGDTTRADGELSAGDRKGKGVARVSAARKVSPVPKRQRVDGPVVERDSRGPSSNGAGSQGGAGSSHSASSIASSSSEPIPFPVDEDMSTAAPLRDAPAPRRPIARGKSWFGVSSRSVEPVSTLPVSHLSTSASCATLRIPAPALQPPSTFSAFPPSPTINSSATMPSSVSSYRSWMSTLSLSSRAVPQERMVALGLPTPAQLVQAAALAPSSASSVSSSNDSLDQNLEGGETLRPRRSRDADTTIKPTRSSLPPAASYQRQSWWNWAPAETTMVQVEETVEVIQEEEVATPKPVEEEPMLDELPTPVLQPKTWLQTFWGDHSQAPVTAAPTSTPSIASVSSASIRSVEVEAPVVSSVPESVAGSLGESVPSRALGTLHTLKNRASALFPRKTSLSDGPPSSIAVEGAVPGADQRGRVASLSVLGRSPLAARAGLASSVSSRASSHSRAGTSAPNSPLLVPQADAPLKPLTGSIRSNQRSTPDEQVPPLEDLVLPTFHDSFLRLPRSCPPKKSTLTKAVSVMSAYLFSHPPPPAPDRRASEAGDCAEKLPKCYEVMGDVGRGPRIKDGTNVVVIGVSGWFPNPMLKSVFGEPTGTSLKFCTMMHDSVQRYLEDHDISSFNIKAIALEGNGIVQDRVSNLFSQLVSRAEWVQGLRSADVVFLATHSQGTIVSTHLLARILEEGLVSGGRISLLAMCGLVQGPFVYLSQSYTLAPYFTILESAAARELFEFQDPESTVSKAFLVSLRTILAHGVKITAIGSINDQVVPLYGALFSSISHPAILRAVFIDSAAFQTSDFLANLVVFAARLRNSGLSDHDLLFHVSEALAGALTGVGHSKLYEAEEVFHLAVRYQFETTQLVEAPTFLNAHAPPPPLAMSFNPQERRNPYLLTWSLRGIVEDAQVRELFGAELTALREAFETWRPTTKVLREVKLKLEGIRMLPRAKREGKL